MPRTRKYVYTCAQCRDQIDEGVRLATLDHLCVSGPGWMLLLTGEEWS